ncbi:hypothetical protein [Caenimonas sp. SL110]|uniref:hypothetical protein n=1 Tax=Caenimonas sp. SL110 TaxID=1450524 RepID=UPI000653BE40|nr:hypothetical protein [Caenimonas sp. SL110]
MRAALFDFLGGHKATTPAEIADAQGLGACACDELISRIAGPELNLRGFTHVEALPPEVWSALQRYAKAANRVGIQEVCVGSGLNFRDGMLMAGLAKLELVIVRSETPVERAVGERLFKSLEYLEVIYSPAAPGDAQIVALRDADFQTPAQNLRIRNRASWAAFDKEVNRRDGQFPGAMAAASHLIARSADMPWGAFEQGLQGALAHCIDTGNVEVIRGIARAVLTSDHLMLHNDRKLSILSGGALAQRTSSHQAARTASALRPAPEYRSPLNAKGAKEALRAQQGKVFVPALGAFVEEPEHEEAEAQELQGVAGSDELEHPAQPARPLRAPLLHALLADPWTPGTPMTTAVLRYVGIGTLIEEVVRSGLDDADIEKLVACEHPTARGPMTWAQLAMANGHPGAVTYAMVAILESPLELALQQRFIVALGVDPATVVTALRDPIWHGANWTNTLIRKFTPRT